MGKLLPVFSAFLSFNILTTMFMTSRTYTVLLVGSFCLVMAIATLAQKPKTTPPPPNPTIQQAPLTPEMARQPSTTNEVKKYEDSADFAKAFKQVYPIIKPKQSVKEQADQYYGRMSRGFAKLDMDSTEMYKMAMKNLDTNASEKLMFDVYRKNLTAKELNAYLTFIKSPEGKKVMDVMPALQRAQTETGGYVSKTINANLAPLRQKQMEMMKKEMPPRDSVKGPDGKMMLPPNPGMDPNRMKMRDSLMKVRQEEMIKNGGGK
jgi:hypothetical protein